MSTVFENIRVVLVNTSDPGNIGASARAMKNMGLSKLVLVQPQQFPSEKATARAANAVDVLTQAQVVDSLEQAIADCGLVIGTSARDRRIPWPMLTPRQCGDRVFAEAATHPVAIIFGREDRGLTNEELQLCHFHLHIPANPDYSSLNLAAALQVVAYEIRMSMLSATGGDGWQASNEWDMPPARHEDVELYFDHLQQTLEKLGFLMPDNPRQTVTRMRRMYNRIRLDQMELGILRGVLTAIQNHIYHADNERKSLEARLGVQSNTESQGSSRSDTIVD